VSRKQETRATPHRRRWLGGIIKKKDKISMTTNQPLDVQAFIDARKFSSYQIGIAVVCLIVTTLDGLDIGVIGSLGPSIKGEWGLNPAQLGRLFGVGLIGLTLGALMFGPLADRYGRRPLLMIGVAGFGLFTLASAYSSSPDTLIVLRFFTGVFLGGALPSAITLASEYAPSRHKFLIVTMVNCGYTIGGALGGVIAARMTVGPDGWRHVLVLGGVLPLLILPLLWFKLPESIRFMLSKPSEHPKIVGILRKIAGDNSLQVASFVQPVKYAGKSPVAGLFAPDMRAGTLLVWGSLFMCLLLYYLLSSWLPTVIHDAGATLQESVLMAAMFPVGSTVGAILLGWLMDRFNPYKVLSIALAVAGLCVVLIGQVYTAPWALAAVIFGAGFGTGGAIIGVDALATALYPVPIRGTGVSWALGIGRIGSIVGSVAGAALLALHLGLADMFLVIAVPAFIGAISIAMMARFIKVKSGLDIRH
jgi:AAHS family 4-hydroxybenzoate transporter-like MFS transporter